MAISAEELANATQLTRAGRLMEATRAIQRALGFARAPKPPAPSPVEPAPHARENIEAVDVAFRETVVPPISHPAPREAESSFTSAVSWSAAGAPLTKSAECEVGGARAATRTTWKDSQDQPKLEVWRIEGGPHAWSGGDAAGSFTDPLGPSASEAMLDFFLLQQRA